MFIIRGGSRISRWGGGGADLQCGHFSTKTYAKTKELDPVGGRVLAAPPASANDHIFYHSDPNLKK